MEMLTQSALRRMSRAGGGGALGLLLQGVEVGGDPLQLGETSCPVLGPLVLFSDRPSPTVAWLEKAAQLQAHLEMFSARPSQAAEPSLQGPLGFPCSLVLPWLAGPQTL